MSSPVITIEPFDDTSATPNNLNVTQDQSGPWIYDLTWDDATWILTASFIIFTMQTGFGMLESGCVSVKNEANIMMKNVVDIVFGGLTYWIFGFSLSFGTDKGSTPLLGIGYYAVDSDFAIMGPVFAAFMFQLSFATTATTIVSGTMAERCSFRAYCIFSLLNTIVYCVPARWIWGPTGFLAEINVIDIAGSGAVHLLGGVSGFVAAWMLGPRLGRYENGIASLPLGNPTNCLVGLFVLWWGWLAFNRWAELQPISNQDGSTFGVSGKKWKFAARASVTTMVASIGGGVVGSAYALFKPGRYFEVMDIVNPILGALVGITAGCAVYHTFEAFIVGVVGGAVVISVSSFADHLRVDDPVGATAVHGFGGLWGMIAVGLFTEEDGGLGITKGHSGVFRGGGVYLLQVQLFACVCISVWAATSTFILLWTINKVIPIRMEAHEELLGADFVEHLVRRRNAGISPALSAIGPHPDLKAINERAVIIGFHNPRHAEIVETLDERLNPWKKVRAKTLAASIFSNALAIRRSRGTIAPLDIPQSQMKNLADEYLGSPIYTITSSNYKTINENNNNSFRTYEEKVFGKLPQYWK